LAALATAAAEDTEPGVTTVTSMSFPHLKAGALRDFERYIYPSFSNAIKGYHKTDHLFSFHNGSLLEFKTYETEFDARGAKRKRLFVNEANTFDYMTWFQLDSRSEQSIIDYNPTLRFWAHDKVIGEPGTYWRISDHRHNPFLPPEKHREIEAFCTFAYDSNGRLMRDDKGEPIVLRGDYELWKVYARGLTGNVTGIIFPDWVAIDELPTDIDNWIYGIDYGYTNDPTCIMKIGRRGKNLYIQELVYQVGKIPPTTIKRELLKHEYNEDYPLYSEHDPDMIRQLKQLDLTVIAARKGPNSIKPGIEKLKEYKVFYTAGSRNLKKELGLYIWEHDDLGNPTNVPVDINNHAIDAIRYAVYSHFYRDQSNN
jgi:phage terminase large subunit